MAGLAGLRPRRTRCAASATGPMAEFSSANIRRRTRAGMRLAQDSRAVGRSPPIEPADAARGRKVRAPSSDRRETAPKCRSSSRLSSIGARSASLRSWKLTRKCASAPSPSLVVDGHFIKTGRQRLDGLHRRGDFGMFLLGDRGGDENAEMPDLVVNHVDDPLAANVDLMLVGIGVGDPVQRLLRRRDIVALAGENNDRRADRLEVEALPVFDLASPRDSVLPTKICSTIQRISASFMKWKPPHQRLEFKETLARVFFDIREEVVIFAEIIAAGIELFEIRHEMRAVENAIAKIGQEQGRQRRRRACRPCSASDFRPCGRTRPPPARH